MTNRQLRQPPEAILYAHMTEALSTDIPFIGEKVVAHELSADASGVRPISRYGEYNEMNLVFDGPGPDGRRDPSTGHRYTPNDFFRYRKKARGRVVGVDVAYKSLVIRPPLGYCVRYWVTIADEDGKLLVELDFKDI